VDPDVYPSGINVPKHFTVMLYSKFKKLFIVKFINKYLLLYLRGSVSVYLTFIKPFNTLSADLDSFVPDTPLSLKVKIEQFEWQIRSGG
jgi:hypothetical protein